GEAVQVIRMSSEESSRLGRGRDWCLLADGRCLAASPAAAGLWREARERLEELACSARDAAGCPIATEPLLFAAAGGQWQASAEPGQGSGRPGLILLGRVGSGPVGGAATLEAEKPAALG